MCNTFVKNLKFTYKGDLNEIKDLTRKCKLKKTKKTNDEYKTLIYNSKGLKMKRTKLISSSNYNNENYKLTLIVNPSRLLCENTNCNTITCESDFSEACRRLDDLIKQIMPGMTINDFKLSRIDFAKDINNIPERLIREYINIMQKMSLNENFSINYKTNDYSKDSFNAIDNQGIEFAVYCKHDAEADLINSHDTVSTDQGTLSIELRCNRSLIRSTNKGLDTLDALHRMYETRDVILNEYYKRLFIYRTDLCYVSSNWQKKMINEQYNGRSGGKKLMKIAKKMRDDENELDWVLSEYYYTRQEKNDIMSEFGKMGFSPIPIVSDHYSFISSLDAVLGFCDDKQSKESEENPCYQKIMDSNDSKKEIFVFRGA